MIHVAKTAPGNCAVVYSGTTSEVINELGAALANVAQEYGALMCLSNKGMTRIEGEDVIVQHVLENARVRLNHARHEREENG